MHAAIVSFHKVVINVGALPQTPGFTCGRRCQKGLSHDKSLTALLVSQAPNGLRPVSGIRFTLLFSGHDTVDVASLRCVLSLS